jgi:coenzyme F420-reducing hydrogenase beta subunit
MKKNISSVRNCYGCLACVDRCPVKCISLSQTELGHVVPNVNENKCIDCQACQKVCPDIAENNFMNPKIAIAAWRKNEIERLESSSGGLATVIAEKIIEEGGVVYGCSFISPFGFKHIRCETVGQLSMLRGSKYVQSLTDGIYKEIANDLKNNKKVLFIGTPCQVAGVKNFNKRAKELYTIDLICHGIPSIKLLKESLPKEILSKKITNVKFRESVNYKFSLQCDDKNIYSRLISQDLYLKAFFTGLDYRDSCYVCAFANEKRVSDLTLGDFWGLKTDISKSEKEKGISLCLVNSENGNYLMDLVGDEIEKIIRPIEEAIAGNHQLRHPKEKNLRTKIFRRVYPYLGFKHAVILSLPDIYIKNKLFR